MNDLAIADIHAKRQFGEGLQSSVKALVGDGQHIRQCGVGEGVGGGASDDAGHVGHAIVDDAFFDVGGIGVSGGTTGFSATALIDADVDKQAA